MVKRIIVISFFALTLLLAQGRSLPAFIYGPSATSYTMVSDSVTVKKLRQGKRFSDDLYITSGKEKTFILVCEETLLELLPGSKILIDRSESYIRILDGNVIIHNEEGINTFCYNVVIEKGSIGYIGNKKIRININYGEQVLSNGVFYPTTDYFLIDKDFIKESHRDGKYILSLIYQYDLPALQKEFNLPSERYKKFRFSTKEKTGSASYQSNSYFHAGSYMKLQLREFVFVYNLWLAISPSEGFYTKNWDEWQDIINNIHYLQIFHPSDPIFLRIGMIEKLEFGRGYLVDNYNNTVILPFENLSGLQIKAGNRNFMTNFFLNDLTRPRIGGAHFNKRMSRRFNVALTYVGDFNQYSNIIDSDHDSYPDKVDPEDYKKNYPNETVIIDSVTTYTDSLISLDNIDKSQLHAIGLGVKYQIANIAGSDVFVTGDFGVLSTPGLGISFPSLFIGNDIFQFSIGADYQSSGFLTSIFDRSYEYNKARFIKNDDGEYELISRAMAIEDENKDWYTGWNTSFNLYLAKRLTLKTKYREVNREDDFKRHVTVSLKSRYSFSDYLKSYSFFIDNKDFDKIFKERTDGQIIGFSISTRPHIAIDVDLRYRQQFQDKDGDGKIQDGDVENNFALNIIIDTNYWWKKYQDRRKNK
ncbi:hypothetical protein ACFL4B_03735 [Candidatus Neomarinimicrobiota bacterium]